MQVVYGTTTTETVVSSTTFTDTTLSATITPTSNTSTILIFVNQATYSSDNNADAGGTIRILRSTTSIFEPDPNGQNTNYINATGASETNLGIIIPLIYSDSPATTSSTTYKTQGRRYGASGSITFQNSGVSARTSTMLLMEIGA